MVYELALNNEFINSILKYKIENEKYTLQSWILKRFTAYDRSS